MTDHRPRVVALGVALLAGAASVPATASAEAPASTVSGGTTTIALGGLRAAAGEPVAVRALGNARLRASLLSLPLAGGTLTASGQVTPRAAAGIALRAHGRTLRLTALRVTLGAAPRVSARVDGGDRVAIFALARSPLAPAVASPARLSAAPTRAATTPMVASARVATTSPARVATRPAALRLTPAGARLLRARLALKRLPRGTVGTLRLNATVAAGTPAPATPAPAAPATPAPTTPPTEPAPTTPTPAPTTPAPAPAPTAPAPAPTTPAPVFPTPDPGAVLIPGLAWSTVVGGASAWSFRGSWLRYLAAGGGSVATSGGATKAADGAFEYPVSGGSYDSAGGWSVEHGGTVAFLYPNHGIEIVLAQPRIELGARAVVNVLLTDSSEGGAGAPGGGAGSGDGTPRRVDFATLDLAGTVPQRDGDTVTWRDVPVLLTAAGAAPFLAYRADEPFGRITIRATVAGG